MEIAVHQNTIIVRIRSKLPYKFLELIWENSHNFPKIILYWDIFGKLLNSFSNAIIRKKFGKNQIRIAACPSSFGQAAFIQEQNEVTHTVMRPYKPRTTRWRLVAAT